MTPIPFPVNPPVTGPFDAGAFFLSFVVALAIYLAGVGLAMLVGWLGRRGKRRALVEESFGLAPSEIPKAA